MPGSIFEVRSSDPDALVRAGADIGNRAGRLQAQMDRQQAVIDDLRRGWNGASADAAIESAERSLQHMRRLHDSLTTLQSALQTGGADLAQQRDRIVNHVDQLHAQGWQVADDGTVSIRPGSVLDFFAKVSPVQRVMLEALAARASAELKAMLAQFDATDVTVGAQIRDAVAGLTAHGPAPASPPPNNAKRSWTASRA